MAFLVYSLSCSEPCWELTNRTNSFTTTIATHRYWNLTLWIDIEVQNSGRGSKIVTSTSPMTPSPTYPLEYICHVYYRGNSIDGSSLVSNWTLLASYGRYQWRFRNEEHPLGPESESYSALDFKFEIDNDTSSGLCKIHNLSLTAEYYDDSFTMQVSNEWYHPDGVNMLCMTDHIPICLYVLCDYIRSVTSKSIHC